MLQPTRADTAAPWLAMVMADAADAPHARPPHPARTATPTASPTDTTAPDWDLITASLRRFALALCGNPDEADELTQQALARVLDRSPDYADHAGYLRQTLTNLWLERRRGLRREIARHTAAAISRLSSAIFPPPAHNLDQQEQIARARRAIDLLPPRQRAALAMRLIEQLSYDDIAAALDTTVAAARANVHLARESLRRTLGDDQ